jgi:hypothetical protein
MREIAIAWFNLSGSMSGGVVDGMQAKYEFTGDGVAQTEITLWSNNNTVSRMIGTADMTSVRATTTRLNRNVNK